MGLFNRLHKRDVPEVKEEGMGAEEYKLSPFAPRKFPMTKELRRRQREDELRKKYCGKASKTNNMI